MANKTINYEELVPKCLGKLPKGPKATELSIAYDAPTDQSTFTYTITWDDAMGTEEQYKKAVDSVANKMTHRMVVRDQKEVKAKRAERKKGKIEKKVEEKEEKVVEKSVEKIPKPQEEPKVEKTVTKSPSLTCSSSSAATSESTESADSWSTAEDSSEAKNSEKSTSNSTLSSVDSLLSPSPPRPKCTKPARISSRSYHEMPTLRSSSSIDSAGLQNDLKSITVKLVVIETKEKKFNGRFGVFSTLETTDLTHVHLVLNDLLRDYRPASSLPIQKLIDRANLYFAFHDSGKPKLRRIRRQNVKDLVFADLPKIRNNVILILDLIGYISKGKRIPIQLVMESEKEKKKRSK